jgi:hypothetical protein
MSDYYTEYAQMKNKYLKLKQELYGGAEPNKPNKPYCKECLITHTQNRPDGGYVWLNKLGYGKVLKVEFEEPVGSGNWRLYTDKWWVTHCRVISHNPKELAGAHIKAFVDPSTRFARMMFYFDSGKIVEATADFYRLEQEYFAEKEICRGNQEK